MANRAPIITKPELGPYLNELVSRYRKEYFDKTKRNLSDAKIASQAMLIPETFRRIKAGDEPIGISLDTAIRLLQIFAQAFADKNGVDTKTAVKLAYLMEFAADEDGKQELNMDYDSLILAALYPLLTDEQKKAARASIDFLSEDESKGVRLRPA